MKLEIEGMQRELEKEKRELEERLWEVDREAKRRREKERAMEIQIEELTNANTELKQKLDKLSKPPKPSSKIPVPPFPNERKLPNKENLQPVEGKNVETVVPSQAVKQTRTRHSLIPVRRGSEIHLRVNK